MSEKKQVPQARRTFLKKAAAGSVLAGLGVAGLGTPLRGSSLARTFKVGIIGCGGRGTDAGRNALAAAKQNGDTAVIHAVADLFPDKTQRASKGFDVPSERVFTGFDAFKKLLEVDCDYVILATPPHFRPEHLEAAISAGKHVFSEKPVAVDPPGIRRYMAAGESARQKGLSIAAGTQRRHGKEYIETKKRIDGGSIGHILNARCYWNMGGLWTRSQEEGWSDMQWQIRNWLYFTWLSGDHIVEQHVHNLDVCNWFIGTHPVAARGMGGRQVRTGKDVYGNIFDHFATELIYPSPDRSAYPDIRVISMCRQIDGCWDDVSEFFVGTKGTCFTDQGVGRCRIHGPNPWVFSERKINSYVQEHMDLQDSIKEGKGSLNEAKNVATSTFTAILARTACYTGAHVRWDDLMKSEEVIGPREYKLDASLPMPPVASPGRPM